MKQPQRISSRLRSPSRWGRARRIVLVLLLAGLSGLIGACGERSAGDGDQAVRAEGERPARSPEERLQREERARALHEATRNLAPGEKVEALSDLAQLYHDTEVAPLAFMDLVFYLSDHSVDRQDDALAALESFERRRPEVPEVLAAANVMYSVATRKRDAASEPEARSALEAIRARALEIYVAAADRLAGSERVKDDWGSHYEMGNAYLLAGRHADAEAAWARVEAFETPAEDTKRIDLMIRRADLLRGPLDRRKDALELFLAVRGLQEHLGRAAPRAQRDYVAEAIEALRG